MLKRKSQQPAEFMGKVVDLSIADLDDTLSTIAEVEGLEADIACTDNEVDSFMQQLAPIERKDVGSQAFVPHRRTRKSRCNGRAVQTDNGKTSLLDSSGEAPVVEDLVFTNDPWKATSGIDGGGNDTENCLESSGSLNESNTNFAAAVNGEEDNDNEAKFEDGSASMESPEMPISLAR